MILDCKVVDFLIELLESMPHQMNILVLDFVVCKPRQTSRVFHLEAFRVDVH